MRKMETLELIDVIGTASAISPRAGQIAFNVVAAKVNRNLPLELSFKGVDDLSSGFCNALFGRLYTYYEPAVLNSLVRVSGVPEDSFRMRMIESAIGLGVGENIGKSR